MISQLRGYRKHGELTLRDNFDGVGWDLGILESNDWQVVGEALQIEVAVLDLHDGADVDLDGEDAGVVER